MAKKRPAGLISIVELRDIFRQMAAVRQPELGDHWAASLQRGLAEGAIPIVYDWNANGQCLTISLSQEDAKRPRWSAGWQTVTKTGNAPPDRTGPWTRFRNRSLYVDRADADRWLEARFNTPPDPSDFDPMSYSDWTLPMALAWIASFDPNKVRWQMEQWRSAVFSGWPQASCTEALSDVWRDHEGHFDGHDAFARLGEALKNGSLNAIALSEESNVKEIDTSGWRQGWPLREGKDGGDVLLVGRTAFTSIKFRRDDVLRLWPAPIQTHTDDWVPVYDKNGKKYSAAQLSVAKFQRRLENGEGPAGGREEEAKIIADWLNAPNGIPRTRGWRNSDSTDTSSRTVEGHIRSAYSQYETKRINDQRTTS